MAGQAKLTIRVTGNRGSSTVQFSSTGRYVSLVTGGLNTQLLGQPIQPTSDVLTFWRSVLALVQAELTALEGP
jgi:hypothetical protein